LPRIFIEDEVPNPKVTLLATSPVVSIPLIATLAMVLLKRVPEVPTTLAVIAPLLWLVIKPEMVLARDGTGINDAAGNILKFNAVEPTAVTVEPGSAACNAAAIAVLFAVASVVVVIGAVVACPPGTRAPNPLTVTVPVPATFIGE
jgi:hypothetical protein